MTLHEAIESSETKTAEAWEARALRVTSGEAVRIRHHATKHGAPNGMLFHAASVPSRPSIAPYQEDIREDDKHYNHLNWRPC